jgi:AraC-like DNA-binding protein
MRNWKLPSQNPDVARYVDCYWFLERKQGNSRPEHPKLNPDPAGHLILAAAEQGYQYDHGTVSAKGKGSHWIFPHCKTLLMDHSQPFLILGIKFHIGALYSLKINPAQPVLDQVIEVDVNTLLKSKIFNETDVLTKAVHNPELCCDSMDELLMPWLLDSHQDKHSRLVHNALSLLSDTPISKMGAVLHCSQRTIERSFLRVTGFTLKQCQSMNRLEAMLAYLHQLEDNKIDWVDIAYRFGFSDQPHLIRYLKSNIGATPGCYAEQRDLAIDVYGDFE